VALTRELSDRNPVRLLRMRLFVALWLSSLGLFLLLVRLYNLQIVRGEELAEKGERNFVQMVRIPHDRGIIYDRYGQILADNRPSLDLEVTPAFLGKKAEALATLAALASLTGFTEAESKRARDMVLAQRGLDKFLPIVIKRDLSSEQVEAVESHRSLFELDGVEVVEGRRRAYPGGKSAAHLLGYLKEIDAAELEAQKAKSPSQPYVLGDMIGRDGVERIHEKDLRGTDGYEKIVVDAKGRRQQDVYMRQLLGSDRRVKPLPGHAVFLTIDAELQARAEEAFLQNGVAGAVVAVDPNTGKVLALVSLPSFDPNLVSGLLGSEEKTRLDGDPLKPWINRAISGQYAPGSTFKAVTALAALRERSTNGHEKVRCPGHFTLGNKTWRCHKDSGHGLVDLREALMVSCDVFFYTMGSRMGIDALAAMGRRLGFGAKTGIALSNEQPGNMPDEAYHNKVDRVTGGYQRGMVINTSIGQGALLVTPVQLAMAYAAIANGKTLFAPQIVDRIETADFRVVRRSLPRGRFLENETNGEAEGEELSAPGHDGIVEEVSGEPPSVVRRLGAIPRETLDLDPLSVDMVHAGLLAVTTDPRGTAYWRRSKIVSIAAKTGTAQVVRLGRDRVKAEDMDYFERDHAWFAAYAPAEDPQIAIAVLNEHSGHGGSKAGPIAIAVIDAFMELQAQRAAQAAAPASGGAP